MRAEWMNRSSGSTSSRRSIHLRMHAIINRSVRSCKMIRLKPSQQEHCEPFFSVNPGFLLTFPHPWVCCGCRKPIHKLCGQQTPAESQLLEVPAWLRRQRSHKRCLCTTSEGDKMVSIAETVRSSAALNMRSCASLSMRLKRTGTSTCQGSALPFQNYAKHGTSLFLFSVRESLA